MLINIFIVLIQKSVNTKRNEASFSVFHAFSVSLAISNLITVPETGAPTPMAYYERRLNPTHLMSHLDNLDAHGMAGNLSLRKRSIQIRKPNRFYYQITLIPKLKASWTNETINFPAGCHKPRTSNPKKTDGKLEVHSKTPTLKQEGR